MLIDILLIALSVVLLVAGAEALVRGACGIALLAKITPAVVGLTIVAAGTSMPEMVVSLQAAYEGLPGLSIGNVVGSNIFNIAVVLGLTSMVNPLIIQGNTVRFEWPVMMIGTSVLYLLMRDGSLDRTEGFFLLAAMISFTIYVVWVGRTQADVREKLEMKSPLTASFGKTGVISLVLNTGAVAIGIVLLAGGSTALVRGATGIASAMGISDTIIGLTIVAAGTSMPELVTSAIAAWRGHDDIAVANVIGSNIFNTLGILGTTALVLPLSVPHEILTRDSFWMMGLALVLFPMIRSGLRLSRRDGAVLFVAFVVYMKVLIATI